MSWTETDPGYRGPKERPLQRNEAAERLRDFQLAVEANSLADGDLWPLKTDAWKALEDWVLTREVALRHARELCDKRVAAERRATVERLDKVLAALVLPIGNDVAYTRGWDAAVDEVRRLLAILDEEAAR